MTGAQRLVAALAAAGVRQLFSLSGNQILSVYDATIGRDIELIHTRHEAAAVHMADAWGRLTEQPGVALVTAGPGMLNAVSSLYAARMAESPLVLMAGASPRTQRGKGAFQEVDQVAAARPVVKAAWSLEDPARVGDDVSRALAIAASGRPGPVYLSLPNDVMDGEAPDGAAPQPGPTASALAERDALAVVALLAEAKRPLILTGPALGRGPRWASVQRLAAVVGAPALPLESPRGVNDPWLRGATRLLGEADVVLLLGKPLDYSLRFGQAFGRGTRVIALDVEAAAGAPGVTLAVAADPAPAAERLAAVAETRAWPASSWRDEVEAARRATPPEWYALRRANGEPIHPLRVCAALAPHLEAGALLVSDGGEFGQWIQAGLEPRERIINGLAGGIGSALPMAIGARRARPEQPVIAAMGDGTFGFHAFELDTALRHGLPVVAVIGNDARWNAEHTLQIRTYGAERTVGCELLPSRYDQLAAALGCHGEYVTRADELEPALARALAAGKPACVNVLIDGQPAPTFGGGGTRGHA
ncbi:MAG TPA: thiamine pyrophosphate-binding protein [Methylomirabilota bacterium]|nr:thiamine pyrophosphate-binding protein [Methylomirabilota bacterium]